MPDSRPQLGHLLEALSIAQRWQTEDPPNPTSQAVLQHGIKVLLAEIKSLAAEAPEENDTEQPPAG